MPLTAHPLSRGLAVAVLLAPLLVAACGADEEPAPPPPGAATDVPEAAEPERDPSDADSPLRISPRAGPPGSELTVSMSGLAPHVNVSVGFGTVESHEIIRRTESDENGDLTVLVVLPAGAERDRSHYVFLADDSERPIAVSDAFLVTGPDGDVRVRGEITAEGVTCTAMRGPEDELYTLVGELRGAVPGDRVTVEGTPAEASICQQGLTIEVREIQVGG